MADKRMFIIPEKLMSKIERHRGQLSRTEFVDYCIECVIKGQETGKLALGGESRLEAVSLIYSRTPFRAAWIGSSIR